MGFNFSHPQKSGGAMAPLAPPSEGALTSNIVFTTQQLSYNFGKNSDLCKCSGGLELLDSPEFCFQKINIPHWR